MSESPQQQITDQPPSETPSVPQSALSPSETPSEPQPQPQPPASEGAQPERVIHAEQVLTDEQIPEGGR